MNETTLVRNIRARLRALGAWTFKVHGGPYQTPGLPDIIGFYHGTGFAMEVKVKPGAKPTPLQAAMLEIMKETGGAFTACVHSVAEAEAIIKEIEGWKMTHEK